MKTKEKNITKKGEKLATEYVTEKGHRAVVRSRRKHTLFKKVHELEHKTKCKVFLYIQDEMDKAEYYASPALQEEFGHIIKQNDVKRAIYLSPNKGNEGSPIKVVTISPTKAIHLRSMLTVSPAKMNEPTISQDPELASVDFAIEPIQYEHEVNDDPTNIGESNGDDSDVDNEGKGDEGIDDNNGVVAPNEEDKDGQDNDGGDNDGQDNDDGEDNDDGQDNDGQDNGDGEDNDGQDNGDGEDDDDEQDSEDLDDHDIYTAEKIIKTRIKGGKKEYFVKWRGWSDKFNSWEPEEHILDKMLITNFEKK